MVNGKPTSLADLGYIDVGLDDNWQECGSYGPNKYTFHDATGAPVINTNRFPNMKTMTDYAHSLGLTAGWYGVSCCRGRVAFLCRRASSRALAHTHTRTHARAPVVSPLRVRRTTASAATTATTCRATRATSTRRPRSASTGEGGVCAWGPLARAC